MTIQQLKNDIENNCLSDSLMIFQYNDVDFLPFQYVNEIKKSWNVQTELIDDLSCLISNTFDIFGTQETTDLRLFICDKFDYIRKDLLSLNKVIVICKSVTEGTKEIYEDCIIEFPKLESWQIKDYVYTMLPGIKRDDLDKLISFCNENIYRIDKEVQKLSMFEQIEQQSLFNDYFQEAFLDTSNMTIFTLSNAILKKDINTVAEVAKKASVIDIEPIGLLKILYNNFKDMISVKFDLNANAQKLGMTDKKMYAVRMSANNYTREQLIDIFNFICYIDKMLKNGELPNSMLTDYLVLNILCKGSNNT